MYAYYRFFLWKIYIGLESKKNCSVLFLNPCHLENSALCSCVHYIVVFIIYKQVSHQQQNRLCLCYLCLTSFACNIYVEAPLSSSVMVVYSYVWMHLNTDFDCHPSVNVALNFNLKFRDFAHYNQMRYDSKLSVIKLMCPFLVTQL